MTRRHNLLLNPDRPAINRDLIPGYVMQRKAFHHAGRISAAWDVNHSGTMTYTVWCRGCPTYVWDEASERWFDSADDPTTDFTLQPHIKPKGEITTLTYTNLCTVQRYGAGYLVTQMMRKAR